MHYKHGHTMQGAQGSPEPPPPHGGAHQSRSAGQVEGVISSPPPGSAPPSSVVRTRKGTSQDQHSKPPNQGGGAEMAEGGKGDAVNLERRVGLISGVALIVGTMIGSGIFVSPKGVLERTNSVGLSLVVWGLCGLLSLLGALCYAELGTLLNESGAEYAYFLETFAPVIPRPQDKEGDTYLQGGNSPDDSSPPKKKKRSVWQGGPAAKYRGPWYKPLVAFLFSWVSVLLLKPSSIAIITLTFAEYLLRLASPGCVEFIAPATAVKLIAGACIILITFINSYSVALATKVQNVFTAAKLLAIVVIVIGGMVKLAQGNTQYLATGFEGSTDRFGDVATAFYSGLWAYDGWNNLNYVTEELKKPYTNLPRAIIIGIPLVTVCYMLVNVSYLAVMSQEELLASETVAVLFGGRLMGVAGEVLMILAVAMSTFGAANGSAFTSGRLCFVAAREGHMVDVLSYVHVNKKTPSTALIFNAAIALLMVIPSDIGSLIDFFSFTAWIFYGGAMVALLVLRRTRADAYRPYKVPIAIPIIVLIIAIYLVIGPIIDSPQIEYMYATLFIVAGVIFYIPFVHLRLVIPGMGHVTTFLQLLLEVVPTDVIPET